MVHKQNIYKKYLKRLLDIVIASVALLLFSPLIIIIGVLVKLKLGSPVIFTQNRPGIHGEVFKLHKFRTMTDDRDRHGDLLSDEKRLTSFGQKLRAMSLDELPELVDVLRGKMSLIGPRPLLCQYLSLYDERQKHRHDVLPGITGLAQISGRNMLEWEERFEKDIEYVNNISFLLDVKIFFITVAKVFNQEGIHSDTSETMEDFCGK